MARRPYIVGNWKMHGTRAMLSEARAIDRAAERLLKVEVALAPPFTLIHAVRKEASLIAVGAQDCHVEEAGAHTGDVSAAMVKDAGAGFTIVGHSERRAAYGESNGVVRGKAEAVLAAGMNVIICLGESDGERAAGEAEAVVGGQLAACLPAEDKVSERLGERITIAYEPVWAIGSGRTPSLAEIGEIHASLRAGLGQAYGKQGADVRILYGGSVNPDNAGEILAVSEVGGALVGGASLQAESFLGIIAAAAGGDDG